MILTQEREELVHLDVQTYEQFADFALQLENEKILEMVKTKG
jgi:hypothetical protein